MTSEEHKLANWLMWVVKGSLIPDEYSEEDTKRVLDSYFKRVWGNHENVVHTEGFEEAYYEKFGRSTRELESRLRDTSH